MVDVVVVIRGLHDLLQVVVVGHAHGNVIGVGLAQIALGIVGQEVLVLIEVERVGDGGVFHAVDVALGIGLGVEELPAATGNLVGTGCHVRFGDADGGTGQDDVRSLDVLHGGHATLEVQVDVQHVVFAYGRDMHSVHVALYVVILVDDGDDLLGREVEDVGVARHIQCAGLRRCHAVDGEVLLQVDDILIAITTLNIGCFYDSTCWNR